MYSVDESQNSWTYELPRVMNENKEGYRVEVGVSLGELDKLIVFNQLTRVLSIREQNDNSNVIEEGQYEIVIKLVDSNNKTNDYLLSIDVRYAGPEPELEPIVVVPE